LNIIYCIDEFPPVFWGGLGTYARETTKRLLQYRIHPAVLSRNSGTLPVSDLQNGIPVYRPDIIRADDTIPYLIPCDVKNWGVPDQRFFSDIMQYNQLGAYHFVRTLHQAKNRQFKLIVAHDWISATAGLIIRENLNIPFIFHIHSHEEGRMESPSKIVCDIERKAAEKGDVIITVSYAMKKALVNLGYQEEKIQVVYNGVDPDVFNPDSITGDQIAEFRNAIGVSDNPMILYVGRLTRIKGVDELIKAMPRVVEKISGIRLVILGVGELETELRKMTEQLGLTETIILKCEHVPEQELIMYYAACDCAVFPSKYEAFGIVCTEAMAMAKPVIAGVFGTGGMFEQVVAEGDEQTGFHVNPYSPEDIAEHICILLNNPEMCAEFGRAGRKRVIELFTWDKAAEKTAEIYRQVIVPRKDEA